MITAKCSGSFAPTCESGVGVLQESSARRGTNPLSNSTTRAISFGAASLAKIGVGRNVFATWEVMQPKKKTSNPEHQHRSGGHFGRPSFEEAPEFRRTSRRIAFQVL